MTESMPKQSGEWSIAQQHFMDGYNTARKEMEHLGWHPTSEPPKVGEDGDVKVIVIQDNHDVSRAIYCEIEEIGIWDLPNIKWWCYPPKED